MYNKKGAELPMNTIVIAIVVVVVLVIIIVFFIGGTSTIAQKIRSIFGGATAGMDRQLAEEFCKNYCAEKRESAYCNSITMIDDDPSPEVNLVGYKCGFDSKAGLTYKDMKGNELDAKDLGMSCPEITC